MIRLVLLRLLETYFRHRFLYLLPILLMAIVGVLSFFSAKASYISLGVIYIRKESFLTSLTDLQDSSFGWVTPAKATVTEFSELLKTDAFRRSIILQTELEPQMAEGGTAIRDTITEVQEAVWVQTLGDNLVMVGAAHGRPEIAQQLVQATIDSFLQWKINSDREESVSAEAFFDSLIAVYDSNLEVARADLRVYLEAHPEPLRGDRPEIELMEIDRLQAEINLAEKQLTNALNQQENSSLAVAQAESAVHQAYLVIDEPKLPSQPASSRMDAAMNSVIFVVVGVVLSVVGVLGAALLDRSHRFAVDVRYTLELPVLALVPDGAAADKPKRKGKKGNTDKGNTDEKKG
ncbi:MAG: lipopolysaccharide biosynthesis protein [Chloroflexi bacterium]|nr:lipopolysaccharide biosynthesis protein [Chloroflexota bacterium]